MRKTAAEHEQIYVSAKNQLMKKLGYTPDMIAAK